MAESQALVGVYATVVTIVLFFQGLEISKWMTDREFLRNRWNQEEDDLLTDKRSAEDFIAAVDRFRDQFPGLVGWAYIAIQAILILITVFWIVPDGFPTMKLAATIPFVVLGILCALFWPIAIHVGGMQLTNAANRLRKKHGLLRRSI